MIFSNLFWHQNIGILSPTKDEKLKRLKRLVACNVYSKFLYGYERMKIVFDLKHKYNEGYACSITLGTCTGRQLERNEVTDLTIEISLTQELLLQSHLYCFCRVFRPTNTSKDL